MNAADRTPIAYSSAGSGAGVVVVHEAMQSAIGQRELGVLLGAKYRVHLVDRRVSGSSGPYPAHVTTAVGVRRSPRGA